MTLRGFFFDKRKNPPKTQKKPTSQRVNLWLQSVQVTKLIAKKKMLRFPEDGAKTPAKQISGINKQNCFSPHNNKNIYVWIRLNVHKSKLFPAELLIFRV